MRLVNENPILNLIYRSMYSYPAPSNITYLWNFGVYALLCLVIQIVTGLVLAMHYVPDVLMAFSSVEHIMRDVNYGWLFRYTHANGASMFFIVVYIHIFRGLYYGSFINPRQLLWIVGVAILLLMIVIAFMGYVLPWGQMSFWGATVITNLFSAVPFVGNEIVVWLWGGYSVGGPTLARFFALHFFFPFILAALVFVHLVYLHRDGSNNPVGVGFKDYDGVAFHPYFIIKDVFGILLFFIFFAVFVFYYPNILGHPDNYIPGNPLVTPPHIVPEWYFLPFYAILRSIPNKLFGVLALLAAIATLVFVPLLLHSETRSYMFKPFSQVVFWSFVFSCALLGWVGSLPVKYPYVFLGQSLTIFYFFYFFVFGPFVGLFEKEVWLQTAARVVRRNPKLYFNTYYSLNNMSVNIYKCFRRVSYVPDLNPDISQVVRFRIDSVEASSAAPLGPILGQYQISMVEFCDSFNLDSAVYFSDFELRTKVTKDLVSFSYSIEPPSFAFFLTSLFSGYGFNKEEFKYSYHVVECDDLWFLVKLFSEFYSVSRFHAALIFFGFIKSYRLRILFGEFSSTVTNSIENLAGSSHSVSYNVI